MKRAIGAAVLVLLGGLAMVGCQSMPPIHVAPHVDLDRFMGPWYVVAFIPLPPERHGYNGVERYSLNKDGSIATTYTFRKGGPHGKLKRYTPTAYVTDDPSNAIWKMQFLWPFKADFRIIWLEPDYQVTVIGRQRRDYVWVMARRPHIDPDTMATIRDFLAGQGYDVSKLRPMPQDWTDETRPMPGSGTKPGDRSSATEPQG